MLELFRRYGPTLMVPAAWITAFLAIDTSLASSTAILVMHVVMTALMSLFLLTGWNQMNSGILKVWRNVIAVGLPFTIAGALSLSVLPVIPPSVSLVAWMILPGIALIYTGRESEKGTLYTVSGLLSLLGTYFYLVKGLSAQSESVLAASLVLVGVGQSMGIWCAAHRSEIVED